MLPKLESDINKQLADKLELLENHFESDMLVFFGPFIDGIETPFLRIVEDLKKVSTRDSIYIMLTTGGGSAHVVERFVNILRYHYSEVNFIVPDHAYSAGTIFCMSGDNIHMDYFSVLGPIDPQVENKEGKYVAALGYLDKINELLEKAKDNTLSDAEFMLLRDFDFAEIREYEQARDLTIDLLTVWLVKYKFKNWEEHRTSQVGNKVTIEEKKQRATEIAAKLSNSSHWKSHGRPINIETLQSELKLEIDDYSKNEERRNLIRDYFELANEFKTQVKKSTFFIQTRSFI